MSKVLFFNPPSRTSVYLNTNVKIATPSYPNFTLATLAGSLLTEHTVKIIDLDFESSPYQVLTDAITAYRPDVIAASVNTPNYMIVADIMRMIKTKFSFVTTVVGGVHVSALPQSAIREGCFDNIVIGEADYTLSEMLSGTSLAEVPGIIYKDTVSNKFVSTTKRARISNINALPYPAWSLFELGKYRNSRLSSRKNPVGLIETSRGCVGQCIFCNKLTFGSEFRPKEYKRVVDEMEYMLKCGFKEIHIIDDSFTQDLNRAKDICREILKRGLKFPWACINGLRVDMVDFEFFKLAKKSGCWLVGYGIESGNQEVLDKANKRTTLAQIEAAVKLAQKADLDTFGFFILGLLGETEKSMRQTIDFAKRLPLDIAKFDICIPYPGTAYFNLLKIQGRIKTEDWSKYLCHQTAEPLFVHPDLSWGVIERYYKLAFREFYLRPNYISRRFIRDVRKGDLHYDIQYFFRSKWY